MHKCGFLVKVKEIKPLRGGVACYAAQALVPIDAEIGQKDHLGMETISYIPSLYNTVQLRDATGPAYFSKPSSD